MIVDPGRLIDALTSNGWTIEGRGRGYIRLKIGAVWVPVITDPTAPEYPEYVEAVLATLNEQARIGMAARRALEAIEHQPS